MDYTTYGSYDHQSSFDGEEDALFLVFSLAEMCEPRRRPIPAPPPSPAPRPRPGPINPSGGGSGGPSPPPTPDRFSSDMTATMSRWGRPGSRSTLGFADADPGPCLDPGLWPYM